MEGSQKYFGLTYFHGRIEVQLHRDIFLDVYALFRFNWNKFPNHANLQMTGIGEKRDSLTLGY